MRKVVAPLGFALFVSSVRGEIIKPVNPDDSPAITCRIPAAVIPLLRKVPKIDGVVDRREWAGAVKLAPFVSLDTGRMTDDPTEVFIAYTRKALYLAFRFDRPPNAREPKSSENPLQVWRDDCIEFFFRTSFGEKWEYSFVGNAKGVYEEGLRRGVTDKKWHSEWTYKARRTEEGWEGEMTIPFKGLGLATPKPGTVWEIAPVRNRKTPRLDLACWAYLKNWHAKQDFGYLIFGGQLPAVRILRAGELAQDEVGALVEVTNFTTKESKLRVQLRLYRPKDESLNYFKVVDSSANPLGPQAEVKEKVEASRVEKSALAQYELLGEEMKEFSVPANQTRRVSLVHSARRGKYLLLYRVYCSEGLLAGGALPFFKRSSLELTLTPYILSTGTVEVIADYRKLTNVKDSDMLTVKLFRKKNLLHQKRKKANTSDLRTVFDVPVYGLGAGIYKFLCLLETADRKEKARREEFFDLPKIPDWWGNTYGIPEKVPEPWTPVKKTSQGFRVWNREIKLGELLQPLQIVNGGVEMLLSPICLDLQLNGLKLKKPKRIRYKETEIAYRLKLRAEGLEGELLLEADFDGFMKYTLFLSSDKSAELKRLVLEIPLKKDLATYYHHGAFGTPPSYVQLKITKGYGTLHDKPLNFPFTDEVWLGNDEMGIQWVAESDQWWSPAERNKTVQLIPSDGTTLLRISIVEKPRRVERELKFQWAIIPTPVKPMNDLYLHRLRYAQSGFGMNESMTDLAENVEKYIEATVEGGANAFGQWAWRGGKSVWNEDFGAPGYRPTPLNQLRKKAFRKAVQIAHTKGIRWVIAYAIWNCFTDWPDVGTLWREQARYPLHPSFKGYIYCPQKPFTDWYIATLRKTILEVGIDGVYLDSSPDPSLCSNLHHGCGYIDEQGELHGTYPIFATRELHKRIYCLFHQKPKKGGLVYAHNSHFIFPAVESFVDIHHCGEGSTLRREIAIPKFYGYPFGIPVSFTRWNNPVYPETRMHSWRFVLQMDSTIKAHPSFVISRKVMPDYKGMTREKYLARGYDPKGEAVWAVWKAYREFPWDGAIWVPSWKADPYAQTGDQDVWVCLHINPSKAALVVVSSFKNEPLTVRLRLNWQKLQLHPQKVKITDCLTFEKLKPSDGELLLKIKPKLWRMLSIVPLSAEKEAVNN